MIRIANNQLKNKNGLITVLIFIFYSFVNAQSSYPINDPRNPDCPCHKYQKLADEEYKKLLAGNKSLEKEKPVTISEPKKINKNNKQLNQNKLIALNTDNTSINKPPILNDDLVIKQVKTDEEIKEIIVSEQKISRLEKPSTINTNSSAKHWKGKRKKHHAHYKQLKRIFYVSDWDIWKRWRNPTACYKWK